MKFIFFIPFLAFAQPTLPEMEIFWIERIPAQDTVKVRIEWYPSPTRGDTIRVQFLEYDLAGNLLMSQDLWMLSDTTKKAMYAYGFRHNSVVFLRWRASNSGGASDWSSIHHFATAIFARLALPVNRALIKE